MSEDDQQLRRRIRELEADRNEAKLAKRIGAVVFVYVILGAALTAATWPALYVEAGREVVVGPTVPDNATVVMAAASWGPGPHLGVPVPLGIVLFAGMAGMFGAGIQVGLSFRKYTGERKLVTTWRWHYYLLPVLAVGLSMFVVALLFATSKGVQTALDASGRVPVLAAFATGGLAGLFSRHTFDWLGERIETILRVENKSRDGLLASDGLAIDRIHTDPQDDKTVRLFVAGSKLDGKVTVKVDDNEAPHQRVAEDLLQVEAALKARYVTVTNAQGQRAGYDRVRRVPMTAEDLDRHGEH